MKHKPPNHQQSTVKGAVKRRRYDAAFKQQAVQHYHRNGISLAQAASELGVNVWTFRDWIEQSQKAGSAPLPASPEALQAEVRRLRQELERVTEQRDILKKSLGILSTT
jgi:transposase-like protein